MTSEPSAELVDLMKETRDHTWSDVDTGMGNYQLDAGQLSGSLEGTFVIKGACYTAQGGHLLLRMLATLHMEDICY